jgi:hypothetical protein
MEQRLERPPSPKSSFLISLMSRARTGQREGGRGGIAQIQCPSERSQRSEEFRDSLLCSEWQMGLVQSLYTGDHMNDQPIGSLVIISGYG